MKGYGKTTAPPKKGGGGSLPEKTPAWPGVPGPTQPKDRSNGTPKVKNCAVKEGL